MAAGAGVRGNGDGCAGVIGSAGGAAGATGLVITMGCMPWGTLPASPDTILRNILSTPVTLPWVLLLDVLEGCGGCISLRSFSERK